MANRIVKIGVAGYKSAMAPIAVNLRDITVLAGPNSAGKSTVIQPLLMIKQTLEKPFDPGGLAIDGPLVKFTRAEQFLSGPSEQGRSQSLRISLETTEGAFALAYQKPSEGGPLAPVEMSFEREGQSVTWRIGQELSANDPSLDDDYRRYLGMRQIGTLRVVRTGCFLSLAAIAPGNDGLREIDTHYSPLLFPMQLFKSAIHLPGLRGTPERSYNVAAIGTEFPGEFVNYVASVIHSWQQTRESRQGQLGEDFRRLGMTTKIEAMRLDDTRIELRVARLPPGADPDEATEMVNIADVGLGVGQVLPILVALRVAERDRIVHIEQPELHLHPRAQVALADLILDAADRGVPVIIETHSSVLLLALQSMVAEGRLAPDRLSLNWFSRDPKGQTRIDRAAVTADGAYGTWPADFGAVEFEAQSRYLDAVARRRAAKRSAA